MPLLHVFTLITPYSSGMSVGGQLPASLIYTVETRPKHRWGYYGALVMMAANVGTLLGNFVGATLRSVLTEEQLVSWGWRIPFLSGILIAFVAMYLERHVSCLSAKLPLVDISVLGSDSSDYNNSFSLVGRRTSS